MEFLRMPLNSNHPRYITTIEDGWLVAIPHPDGRYIHKTFRPQTDARLNDATNWRDNAYSRIYNKPVPNRVFHEKKKETVTGIPGIRYTIKKVKKKSGRVYAYPVIMAELHTIPGKDYVRPKGSRSKLFSLTKYDWDEAIALATAWLQDQRTELQNTQA
jgi:hypothetical protein